MPVTAWNCRQDFAPFNVTLRRRKYKLPINVAAACRDNLFTDDLKMKTIPAIRSLILGACAALWITSLAAAELPREHLSLDANWKFHLGDDWPDALSLMNSGTGSGPASEKFSDSFWRTVNLPHDWAVELPFDWAADGSHGFHTLGVKYPTNSIVWYRRTFDLPMIMSSRTNGRMAP